MDAMNFGNWLLAGLAGLCISLRIDFLWSHFSPTLFKPVLPKTRFYVNVLRFSREDGLVATVDHIF